MSMNYDIYDIVHGGDNDDIGTLVTDINGLTDTLVYGPYNFAENGIEEMRADIDNVTNFPDLVLNGPYNLSTYDGREAIKALIEGLAAADVRGSLVTKDVRSGDTLGFVVSGTGTTFKGVIPIEFPHKNANTVLVIKDTGSSNYLASERWNTQNNSEVVVIMSS